MVRLFRKYQLFQIPAQCGKLCESLSYLFYHFLQAYTVYESCIQILQTGVNKWAQDTYRLSWPVEGDPLEKEQGCLDTARLPVPGSAERLV